MSTNEIVSVVSDVVLVLLWLGSALFLKSYLPSYFKEKGKNLATKEDIEDITERAESARQRQQRKEEKIKTLLEYLSQFAGLVELYRFRAHGEGHLETYEQGNLVWRESWLEPDPALAQAFEETQGIPLQAAIYQRVVEIRLKSGTMSDITREFDSSGELNRKFAELFEQIRANVEPAVERRDFRGLVTSLDQASQMRRGIHRVLQGYLEAAQ